MRNKHLVRTGKPAKPNEPKKEPEQIISSGQAWMEITASLPFWTHVLQLVQANKSACHTIGYSFDDDYDLLAKCRDQLIRELKKDLKKDPKYTLRRFGYFQRADGRVEVY